MDSRKKKKLAAIVSILVCIVIVAMFAIIKVKALGERLVCGVNMKGFGNAIDVYRYDYANKYPDGSQWCDLLMTHADVGSGSFVCPGEKKGPCNYALNINALSADSDLPPDMVLMFECGPGWNQVGGPELLSTENHNGDGCNVLFVNGDMKYVKTKDLDGLRWTVEQRD